MQPRGTSRPPWPTPTPSDPLPAMIQHCLGWLIVLSGLLVPVGPAWGQIDKLPRPDDAHAASFGVSVALGDSLVAVGASGESTCGANGGAVYVYERTSSSVDDWDSPTRLAPEPCVSGAFFGEHVALSGNRLLVSASDGNPIDDANAAYLFERTAAGTWQQAARFTAPPGASDGPFAADIDLHGNRAVVSTAGRPEAGRSGAVYVYEYADSTGTWGQTARLTSRQGPETGILGGGVSLHGAHVAVAVSTYFRETPGSARLFHYDASAGQWRDAAVLRSIDAFFIELALHDSTLLVGEDRASGQGAGEAAVFTRETHEEWPQTATLHPSRPYASGAFGMAVALGDQWALVTGYGEQLGQDVNIDREVYTFRRTRRGTWEERSIIDIGQVDFGAALDVHGSQALVSSVPPDEPGTVYLVQLP